MKTADVKAALAALTSKVDTGSDVYGILNDSSKAAIIDMKSDHTYYGLPESCIEDINTCISIIEGVYNKLDEIV